MKVFDDGIGFEADSLAGKGGMGLINIRERAENLGGTFSFDSSYGRGVLLMVTVPRNV
jgi:signal transduction histidine kinase